MLLLKQFAVTIGSAGIGPFAVQNLTLELNMPRLAPTSPSCRRARILAAIAAVPLVASVASAQVTYTGPVAGNWSVNGNWTGGVFPNATTVDAVINGNVDVTVEPGVTRDVRDLTIGSASDVFVSNNSFLEVNRNLFNSGTLNVVSTGNSTRLRMIGGGNISGGGTINLTDGTLDGGGIVTNVDNLITGTGFVGTNTIRFDNQGTIRAQGGTLVLDPASVVGGAEFFNTGTLFANGTGSILVLTGAGGGEFDSVGGTIRANNGIVRLTGSADVTGGTYTTTGSGVVEVEAGSVATLRDFANTGSMVARNSSDLRVVGTVDNGGSITIDSTGGARADLQLLGNTTLAGNGTVNLVDAGINGGGVLTIGSGHTVRGSGLLGQNALRVENLGTIRGDVAGQTLVLDPSSVVGGAEFFNSGLIRASNAGNVTLTGNGGGEFANTTSTGTGSGVMEAVGAGSEIVLTAGANLTGGTLRGTSGGVVRTGDGENVFVTNVVHQGTHVVGNNSDYGVGGTITLDAGSVLNLNAGAAATDLELQGNVDLVGSGTVRLNGSLAGINGGGVLTVGNNVTIGGQGRLGQNAVGITNRGTILGDVNGQNLTLDPYSVSGAAEFINTGLVRAVNGGSVTLTDNGNGEFTNTETGVGSVGVFEAVGSGSQLVLDNARVFNGTLRGTGGGVVRTPAGSNTFVTDLTLSGTHIVENNADFGIDGTVTVPSGSTLRIQAGANATDLEVQSTASLAGSGTIILEGALAGINGSGTLTVPSGMTIRGEGRFGQNAISVVNNGLINANVNGKTLTLDPASVSGAREFDNNGTLRASSGGTLAFTNFGGGEFDNTGALIEATGNGSKVQLTSNANLAGGTLRSTNGGSVVVGSGENVIISDLTFSGVMNVGTNTDLGIDGTVVNDGTITLDGTGAQTDLEVQASATFAGSGNLVLAGPSAGINGSGTLLNDSGNTIRGQGNVGRNAISITNDGFIIADVPGQELVLDPASVSGAAEFINNGVLRAQDGGILVFDGFGGGEFLNNNSIEVVNGGQLLYRNNASLTNASVASSDRLIGGTFRVFDNGVGTTFNIVPPAFDLEVNESATIEIQGPNVISNLFDDAASSAGNLVGFKFRENGGTFIIGGGTDLTVTLPQVAPNFIEFDNAGTFFVDSGSTVNFRSDFGNGFIAGTTFNNTGTLGGGGTLDLSGPSSNGFLDARGGTIAVGDSANTAAGTLNIIAGQVAVDNAVIEVDLFGKTSFDILSVDGDFNVLPSAFNTPGQGTIAVGLGGGFLPDPGDAFEVIVADSVSGSFSAVQDANRAGLIFSTLVGSDSITIIADNLLEADFNYDGIVSILDFAILRSGFGSGTRYVQGDANQDGTVSILDFAILRANFGTMVSASQLAMADAWAATVPEPTTALAAFAAGGVLLGRRRR